MGCNTSQELKAKDGTAAQATATEGDTGAAEPNANINATIENGEVTITTKSNGIVGDAEAEDGANSSLATSVAIQQNQTNHSKSNSIITNGDAVSNKKQQQQQQQQQNTKDPSTSPKQNGAVAMLNGSSSDGEHNGAATITNTKTNSSSMAESIAAAIAKCDKAEISELNDMELGEDEANKYADDDDDDDDDEDEVEIRIPHGHHHHGSKKIRRNPLKNLDLDFKFDVNSF